MCFNAAKTYQLGWYSQYHVDLSTSATFNWNGNLVGFAEKSSASTSDKMIIRIITSTTDTYVHFNRRIGMNIGTQEAGDQVLVTTRNTGTGYAESNLVSKMSTGSVYTVNNFNGSPNPLVIRVVSISTNTAPGRANISIQFGVPVPTPAPTPQPTPKPVFQPTPFPTPQPTRSPTPQPTPSPTPQPTPLPTPEPTIVSPIPVPTVPTIPVFNPVSPPVSTPVLVPVVIPTPLPTPFPTPLPTPLPTPFPTPNPTRSPISNSTCNFNRKCEAGEDCKTCPSDCNGRRNLYCCVGGRSCNRNWCNHSGRSCAR
jgi:hypothetical protein